MGLGGLDLGYLGGWVECGAPCDKLFHLCRQQTFGSGSGRGPALWLPLRTMEPETGRHPVCQPEATECSEWYCQLLILGRDNLVRAITVATIDSCILNSSIATALQLELTFLVTSCRNYGTSFLLTHSKFDDSHMLPRRRSKTKKS